MPESPQHVTLVANTVTTVAFAANVATCRVTNIDGAGTVYYTADNSTPVIAGTGCEVVTAGVGAFSEENIPGANDSPTNIKLISSAAVKVAVRAW